MTSNSKGATVQFSDQLSEFEAQLRLTLDGDTLQQDVFRAIRELLSDHQGSEEEIRRVLAQRFEAGMIREETLQIVQQMLNRAVSEHVATSADADPDFAATDVLDPVTSTPPTGPERIQPGSILRDRFLLQREVSGGSMGVVYKALDRRLAEVEGVDPWVAIKVLNPKLSRNAQALRAIQQEAAKGRCLAHDNIVRFVDFDREDDLYFLVMEWIDGRSLAQVLDDPDCGRMDVGNVQDVVGQLGNALEYAHRCGVVHADVKPGNVMLTDSGKVKLIDFGVARVRQQQQINAGNFNPGVLGAATPAYSSMQVLTGEEPVPSDDVFSLACLVYRMIAGYRVFGPRNAAEAAEAGMTPQQPQGLSDAQWAALKKALSFTRVTRFASAREFVDAFLGGSSSVDATQSQSGEDEQTLLLQTRGAKKRGYGLLGFGLLGLLVLGGASAWQLGLFGASPNSNNDEVRPGDTARSTRADNPAPNLAAKDVVPTEDLAALPAADPASTESNRPTERPSAVPPLPAATTAVAEQAAETPSSADDSAEPDAATAAPQPARVATHRITLPNLSSAAELIDIRLDEAGPAAVIAIERAPEERESSSRLRLVAANGESLSAAIASQLSVPQAGEVRFEAFETTAWLELLPADDGVRQPDRSLRLNLYDPDRKQTRAILNLHLLDDDTRLFEAQLPPDTIGFLVSQVSVNENQTAAQISVRRYRPSDGPYQISYRVEDVTATESLDYFSPGDGVVRFEPGEQVARIFVPLVQDSDAETDEAFFIELDVETPHSDIYRRVAVMIRDDDS